MTQEPELQTANRQGSMPLIVGIEHFASGNWIVQSGREADFVDRWSQFLAWTREEAPGLRGAMLMKDASDGRHFVSFAAWQGLEELQAWRSLPAFAEKMAACRALCQDFQGSNYELMATA
jgi:heme-degrading monooxygenase HmoA